MRRLPVAAVPSQQDVKKVGWGLDLGWPYAEDVTENEVLRRVLPECLRLVPPLRAVNRAQMGRVQSCQNRMAEAGEQLGEAETQRSPGLQEIVGDGGKIIVVEAQEQFRLGAIDIA